ncbi:high-affinity lysophosphatidic acid receptor-like isoform X1 [Oculina patagonica]
MADNTSQMNSSATHFTCYDPAIFLRPPASLHTNYIIASIFNTLFSFTAFFGNALILTALRKASSINSASNSLLCSLALSDLMVGLVVQPLHVIYCIYGIVGGPRVRCYSRIMFAWSSDYFIAVSFLTIVAISLDRYLALCHRHRYRSAMTRGRTKGVITVLWVLCLSFPVGRFVSSSIPMILSSAVFIVFLVIPSYAVYKIYRFLKQHEIQISSQFQHSAANSNKMTGFNVTQYKRSVITLLCVYFALLACFLPSVVVTVAWVTADQSGKFTLIKVGNFSLTFLMFNSSLNPFLYCWRIREVRKLCMGLLKKWFCSCNKRKRSEKRKISEETRL